MFTLGTPTSSSKNFPTPLSVWAWIALTCAATMAFFLVYIAVINLFYSAGDMTDPGWLSALGWHANVALRGPPAFSDTYFSEHISPILWLPGYLSYLLPWGRIDTYAGFMGVIYALFAAGIFKAWLLYQPRAGFGEALAAFVVALLATFSAVGMANLRLAHYELALPALGMWFFIALAERRYRQTALWFALCLMVREDAGFHLFGLLFLWRITLKIAGQNDDHAAAINRFAGAAFAYSVLALAIKHLALSGANNFYRAYSGAPPWTHVTHEFISQRLRFYLTERTFITVPFILTLLWAVISRNPLLPLGYIAFLPWLVLSFMAVHVTTGSMAYYYAFPYWLSLGWPLVALHIWPPSVQKNKSRWPYMLVLAASLMGWTFDHVVFYPIEKNNFPKQPFIYSSEAQNRAAADRFVSYLAENKSQFGKIVADMAVLGLAIEYLDRSSWFSEQKPGELPDTILYFPDSFELDKVDDLIKTGVYKWAYAIRGTRIRIATKNALPLPVDMAEPLNN